MASQQEVVERLFEAALSLDSAEREAFLDRECSSDPDVRRVVEELLADNAHAGSFLLHPPFEHIDKAAFFEQLVAGETRSLDSTASASPGAPAQQLWPGQVLLNRFVVVRFIAKGGMGEVYEAEDRHLQRTHVAIKTILPRVAQDPSLRERFEREVLLAREVIHQNLCPIYELFRYDEQPPGFLFLEMKLLPGTTLTQRLKQTPALTKDEQRAVVRQISAGLVAIHDAGIVHRDIKPSNIMLDGSGTGLRLWITDFGLARALENETALRGRSVAGTPGYIAPELYAGQAPSSASDFFAFGVVLHELFTGEKPVVPTDGGPVTISPKLSSSGAPSFCVQLVRGCLDLDPKRRCEAFDHALVSLGLKRRQRKPWTRRQFITTAATVVCALGGVGWWEWDKIEDLTHPIPQKRFVALLNWPKTSDVHVLPMLTGALTAIKNELARFEAFDRDLFVISPEEVGDDSRGAGQLKEVCDPLGVNLALAASGFPGATHFELLLRLLDSQSSQPLRTKQLSCKLAEITSLPAKAVQAAASLLNLDRYSNSNRRSEPETQSAAAFTAFQSAETLVKQPNDTGLEAAIDKYKEALDLDPRYAAAYAALAFAYGRLYALHHDSAMLELARGNCEAALKLNPDLVEAHLALASVLGETGNTQSALEEIAKALALDPSNPMTLVSQGQIYSRLNRWADSERSFQRVLRERPNYWLAYNELGVALNSQGKYPEAIEAFRKACIAAPRSSLAFNNVGAVYLQIGDFSNATESFKKSLALKPNGMAASNTSLALRSEGKYAEALPFAQKSVELDPGNDANWLELGDCYSSLHGHQREAVSAYQRAADEIQRHLRTDATDGPSWMASALYLIKSGNRENALSNFKKAESLGANDMDSQLTKARILELLGRRDDALATLAVCFQRGATRFEIVPVPDFGSLQKDSRYREILRLNANDTKISEPTQVGGV